MKVKYEVLLLDDDDKLLTSMSGETAANEFTQEMAKVVPHICRCMRDHDRDAVGLPPGNVTVNVGDKT